MEENRKLLPSHIRRYRIETVMKFLEKPHRTVKVCRVEVFFKTSPRRNVSVTRLAGWAVLVGTKKKSLLGSPQQAMMASIWKKQKVTIAVSLERLPLETDSKLKACYNYYVSVGLSYYSLVPGGEVWITSKKFSKHHDFLFSSLFDLYLSHSQSVSVEAHILSL